jgi:hypothetical protein
MLDWKIITACIAGFTVIKNDQFWQLEDNLVMLEAGMQS